MRPANHIEPLVVEGARLLAEAEDELPRAQTPARRQRRGLAWARLPIAGKKPSWGSGSRDSWCEEPFKGFERVLEDIAGYQGFVGDADRISMTDEKNICNSYC